MQKLITNNPSKAPEPEVNNVVKTAQEENIKNLQDQISLEFGSFSSNLTPDQQAEVDKYLWSQQVKSRVYFVRHGQSVEDEWTQNIQTSEAELTVDAKNQFNQITKDLKKKGLTSENTYMMYHNGTDDDPMVRIIESAEIIQEWLAISSNRVSDRVKGLDTTDKDDLIQAWRSVVTAKDVVNFCKELSFKAWSVEGNVWNINIVCVVHKSNIWAIRSYFFKEKNQPVDLWHGWYQNGEIQEVDFTWETTKLRKKGLDWAKALNYRTNKTILSINSQNVDSVILDVLAEEEELKWYIDSFREWGLQIFELQNLVNVYFIKNSENNTELFENKDYLLSDSHDLRVFCVANLVQKNKFNLVEEKFKDLLNKEKEISVVKLVNSLFVIFDEEQTEKFIDVLVEDDNVWSWLNSDVKKKKLEFYLNYRKYTKYEIWKLREKSLDERLKKWEDVIISLWFQWDKYKSMDELLSWNWITLIEWEAGAGKSIKLLEIMEYLRPSDDNNLFPVHISLWWKSLEEVKKDVKDQKNSLLWEWKYNFVYLFDAMDEAKYNKSIKEEFMEYVNWLEWKVILTSRLNNINNKESKWKNEDLINIEKLELKILDTDQIEEFINNYLSKQQQQIWKKWKEKEFIKGIEKNPLMLSIICELIISWEDLEIIKTKSDLYEKIVYSRLWKWEKSKKRNAILQIDKRIEFLTEIAYKSFVWGKKIDKKLLENMIQGNDRYRESVSFEDEKGDILIDLECLNMIFRKNKAGDYSFIHESFREYFFFLGYKENKEEWLQRLDKDLVDSGDLGYEVITLLSRVDEDFAIEFLGRLVELEGFQNNRKSILYACRFLWDIGNIEIISILEKIIELEWFKNNRKAIVCSLAMIHWEIVKKAWLKILEKIIKMKWFHDNKKALDFCCKIIWEIWEKEWLETLEKFIEMEWFQNNENIIDKVCWAIRKIWEKEWLQLLEKIIALEWFKKNIKAMIKTIITIWKTWDKKWLKLLEKFIEMEWFQNNENIIDKVCW